MFETKLIRHTGLVDRNNSRLGARCRRGGGGGELDEEWARNAMGDGVSVWLTKTRHKYTGRVPQLKLDARVKRIYVGQTNTFWSADFKFVPNTKIRLCVSETHKKV